MANPQIKIDITSSLDNKGTKDLRSELNAVVKEMDNLRKSGQSGSDAFTLFKNRANDLTKTLKGVSRENKGLDADTKLSSRSLLALGRDITIVIAGLKQFGASLRSALNEGAEFGVLKDNFIALEGGIEQATEKLRLLRNASTGNLDDKELIQYSNKMKLLGVSTDDTAKFLDIIEVQSDKVKIGFEQGEKVLQKYLITGRDKSLMELGINVADINNKIKEQTGLTTKQVKLLDDETQQRIRLNAILSLNIGTTGNLNDKTRDNADKIKSVESALKNVTLNYQYTIANGIVKYSEALGISNTVMESVIGKVGFLGKSLAELAPILATLKIAFPAAFSAVLPIIAAVSLQIGGLILLVKSFKDSIPDMIRAFQFAKDVISGENISESFQKGVDDYNKQHQKTSEELGIDEGNKYVKGIVDKFQEQKKLAEEKIQLEKDIKRQMDELNKKTPKGHSPKEEKIKEKNAVDELIKAIELELKTKELEIGLNEDNKLLLNDLKLQQQDLYKYSIDKLKKELDTNTVVEERIKLTEKLIDLAKQLDKVGKGEQRGNRPDRTPSERGDRPIPQRGGSNRGGRGIEAEIEEKSPIDYINDSIAGFDGMVSKTQTMLENFGLMDTATGRMINAFSQIVSMIQSLMNVGSGIFDIVTGIASFFIPGAGAIGAIARADGGSVNAGKLHLVGERGAELFIPKVNGSIVSNEKLTSLINSNMNSSTPNVQVIVNTEFDQVKSYEVVYNGNRISNLRGSNNL